MTDDELKQRNAAQRVALDQMHTACAGALGLLTVLLKHGYVPEHHRESAEMLIAKYHANNAAFFALDTPTEPA
jgi:hypothetical protein